MFEVTLHGHGRHERAKIHLSVSENDEQNACIRIEDGYTLEYTVPLEDLYRAIKAMRNISKIKK